MNCVNARVKLPVKSILELIYNKIDFFAFKAVMPR
jgi:hypothetical protein